MAHFPSVGPRSPSSGFNYPPPGYSPPPFYPSGPMNTFNPSYPGIGSPMIPIPSIGPSLPPSFHPPPPSYTFVPPTRPPSFSPPTFRPPPSFDASPGRIERFNPPSIPQGLTPSWAAAPSLPPHLSPSYPSISSLAGSSPFAYSLNPPSFHSPAPLTFSIPSSSFSLPPSSFNPPSFPQQPPSLSGRAYISPFTPSSPGILLPRNQEVTVWTPPSFSRSPFPSDTLGKVSGHSPSFRQHRPAFLPAEDRLQFHNSVRQQLEEAKKIISLMDASPDRPFPIWETVGVPHFALQINPNTTVFLNPVAVTEFFQRASEPQRCAAQAQLIQFMKSREVHTPRETWVDRIDRKAHELGVMAQSGIAHAIWDGVFTSGKVVAAFGDAILKISKPMIPDSTLQNTPNYVETAHKSITKGHQKIDEFFGTNLAGRYDPLNQRQFVQAEAPGGNLGGKLILIEKLEQAANIEKAAKAAGALSRQTVIVPESSLIIRPVLILEEIVKGKQITSFAKDLGFSRSEIVRLQQAGRLDESVALAFENVVKVPARRESFELFNKAQEFLKPYNKQFMVEAQCRELIHKTGIRTLPRPAGIPENFRIRVSDKGVGLIYVHPEHTHTSIRVMPGKPHSPFHYQQTPYVIYRKNGETLDKFGKVVDSAAKEAHISIEEFIFKD